MKVSVIGCGTISKTHLQILSRRDDIEIASVVDIDKEKADLTAKAYGAKAFYDIDTMLLNDKPEAVHVLTPHYLHAQMAVKCLEMGIHVLSEKPCGICDEDIERLNIAEKNSNALYGVCFQNRYNETVKEALQRIKTSAYGKMTGITGQVFWNRDEGYYSDGWHGIKAKEGGGVLINQAIHTQDLMGYLAGASALSVTAHLSNDHLRGAIDVEDTAFVHIRYENGVKGILCATTAFCENSEPVIEMFFEKGKMRIQGSRLFEILPDAMPKCIAENKAAKGFGKAYWGNAHGFLINDFYDRVNRREEFFIDSLEGGRVTREIFAAYVSDETNREVFLSRKDNNDK